MRVLLDDIEIPTDRPTLGGALRAVRAEAERRGRVVIEAQMDGQPIPDRHLESPPEDLIATGELRFITTDPVALVKTTFMDVADALDGARTDQAAAADLIQTGQIDQGLRQLGVALGVWENVRQAVSNGVALIGLNADALSVPSNGQDLVLSDCVTSLAGRLGEVKRSVLAQDWSGLSDALSYDMEDQAKDWTGLLRGLAETISRPERAGQRPPPATAGPALESTPGPSA